MASRQKITIITLSSAVIVLLAVFLISFLAWSNKVEGKIPDLILAGKIDLSLKDETSALEILREAEDIFREQGLLFVYNGKSNSFPLKTVSFSADIPEASLLYSESVVYDHLELINSLINSNQGDAFLSYLTKDFFPNNYSSYPASFYYSPEIITDWIKNNFPETIIEPVPAFFSLEKKDGADILINNPEKIGKEINLLELIKDVENRLSNFDNSPITIKTKSKYPEVKQADLEPLRSKLEEILNLGELTLTMQDFSAGKEEEISFNVDLSDIITWISPQKNGLNTEISFDANRIEQYLKENLSSQIDKPVVLPRFEIKDEKVSSWQAGEDGREIDLEKTAAAIIHSLLNSQNQASLIIKEIRVDDLDIENNFKIKEIIGTGHSNFAGSSANRRHNIKIGAQSIHGMLIKPGEEFSLIGALGEIDAAAGYLPELVIKGNKTIPEYGGGLCQVATTVFRSVVQSGLPVTARRNHSYRVSYYEPAGTDATIYDPWPDFKFINDTANYVLIQSRIEGDNLYFDFWGTKDGRVITVGDPVIYNIVKPPETKYIETDELAPGEKKCTERAHNGADAYFDYIVTYPEGATTTPKQEVRFKSHYVPWQEVCLIGRAIPIDSGTSTELLLTNEEVDNTETTDTN